MNKLSYLTLMALRFVVQMKEPIAVGAQISTYAAQNDGQGFRVVVIVTKWLKRRMQEELKVRNCPSATFNETYPCRLLRLVSIGLITSGRSNPMARRKTLGVLLP